MKRIMRSKAETPSKTDDDSPRVSPRKRPSPARLSALRGGHFQKANDGSRIYRRRSSGGVLQEEDASNTSQEAASPVLRKRPSDDIPATGSGIAKRLRTVHVNSSGETVESDGFCWVCHKEAKGVFCEICPRVYHKKCLSAENIQADWVCPVCEKILQAECVDTQTRAMSLLSLDQLCVLLKYALQRMRHTDSEDFHKPVDPGTVPQYSDFVYHPMDISTLEKNIRKKLYGSTEAFLADARYILHNCVIFNGEQSKLTANAKMIIKICKHETSEIEICPDCYLNSCTQQQENWFCEPCRHPHTLVWAKMKGYPYWPAKALRELGSQIDVRFFGEHDRAWVPMNQVFLLSTEPPAAVKKGRGGYERSMGELQLHISKLIAKFGGFEYAPHKMLYDAESRHFQFKSTKSHTSPKVPASKQTTPSKPKPSTPVKSPEKQASIAAKTASAVKLKYNSIISTRYTKERGKTIGDNVILSPSPIRSRKKALNVASPLARSPVPSSPGPAESVQTSQIKDIAGAGETVHPQANNESTERSPEKIDATAKDSPEGMAGQDTDNPPPLTTGQSAGDSAKTSNEGVEEKAQELVDSPEATDADDAVDSQSPPRDSTDLSAMTDPGQVDRPQPTTVLPGSIQEGPADSDQGDKTASVLVDEGKSDSNQDSPGQSSTLPSQVTTTEQPAELEQGNLEASTSKQPGIREKSSDKEPSKIFVMTEDKQNEFEAIQPKTDLSSILEMVPKLKSTVTNVAVKIAGKIRQINEDGDSIASSEDQPAEDIDQHDTVENKSADSGESDAKTVDCLACTCTMKKEATVTTDITRVDKTATEDSHEVDSTSAEKVELGIDKPANSSTVEARVEHGLGIVQTDIEKKNPFLEKLVASCKEKLGVDDEQVAVDPMQHWSVAVTDDSDITSTDDNSAVDSPMSATSAVPDASCEASLVSDASSTSPDQRASPETVKDSDKDNVSEIPETTKASSTNESHVGNSPDDAARATPVTQSIEKLTSDVEPQNAASLKPNVDIVDVDLTESESGANNAALSEPETGTRAAALSDVETGAKDAALSDVETGTRAAALTDVESGAKDAALVEPETGTRAATLSEPESQTRDSAMTEPVTGTRDSATTEPDTGTRHAAKLGAGTRIAPIVIGNEESAPDRQTSMPTVIHEDPNDISMEDATGDEAQSTRSSLPPLTDGAQRSGSRETAVDPGTSTAPSVSTSVVKPIVATHCVKPQVSSRPQAATVHEKGSETQATSGAGTSDGNATSLPPVDDLGTLFNVNGLDLSKYTEKISVAVRETMMGMCEDLISTGVGSTFRNHLQLEAQRLQWRHRQEISEIRHTINLKLLEIRASMELEKDKAVDKINHDLHTKFELEKQQAIEETKRKQWCAGCGKEAIFYCCWNTSYCDYPCQQAHWPKHMASCTQTASAQPPPDQSNDHAQPSSGSVSKGVSLEPFAPMGSHGNQGLSDYNKSPYQHSPAVRQISPIGASFMKQPISQLQLMRPQTRPRMVQYIQQQPGQMYRQPPGGAQFQYGGHVNMHQSPVIMATTSSIHHPNAPPHQSHLGPTAPGPMGAPSQSILLTQGARLPSTIMPGASPYHHNNF